MSRKSSQRKLRGDGKATHECDATSFHRICRWQTCFTYPVGDPSQRFSEVDGERAQNDEEADRAEDREERAARVGISTEALLLAEQTRAHLA